jgi:hypothetical protein
MNTNEQELASGPVANRSDAEPKRDRLSRILAERPEARPRLRRAIGSLLGVVLVFLVVLGFLMIWHLRRRAQLIRNRLSRPRDVSLPDPAELRQQVPRPPQGSDD